MLDDADFFRPFFPSGPFFDFSYTDRPNVAALWRHGIPEAGEYPLIYEAAGWMWLFNGGNSRHGERITRLQRIFGCANVTSGPRIGARRSPDDIYGVWVRRIEFQTRKHRTKATSKDGEDICRCGDIAALEDGSFWETYESPNAYQPSKQTWPRPWFIGEAGVRIEYATEDELLDFANKIRAAGGANALDALLPSDPQKPDSCLIATSLNFGCHVVASGEVFGGSLDVEGRDEYAWAMRLPSCFSVEESETLASAVGCEYDSFYRKLILPRHIGNAARAFDLGKGWTRKYRR